MGCRLCTGVPRTSGLSLRLGLLYELSGLLEVEIILIRRCALLGLGVEIGHYISLNLHLIEQDRTNEREPPGST